MLTISEDLGPGGCGVRSAGVRLGLLRLEAGTMRAVLAHRLEPPQSAIVGLGRGWHRNVLKSIGRAAPALKRQMAVVIQQKRPA